MNIYRVTDLGSLTASVDLIAEDENDAARAYAWRFRGIGESFVEAARPCFVPAFACVGWHARLEPPGEVAREISIVIRVRDCVVHR